MKVWIVYADNYGELEVECPHSEIHGVFDSFEKAKEQFLELLTLDEDWVLDENYKEGDLTATLFYKLPGYWGNCFELIIKECEVE